MALRHSSKYLTIDWGYPIGYRKWKVRHNKSVSSIYVQMLWLEVCVWYR